MKFTIRDQFLVTTIVALATGWGIDRWKLVRDYEYIIRIERKGRRDAEVLSDSESVKRLRYLLSRQKPDIEVLDPPTSQAPAPNPPQP